MGFEILRVLLLMVAGGLFGTSADVIDDNPRKIHDVVELLNLLHVSQNLIF